MYWEHFLYASMLAMGKNIDFKTLLSDWRLNWIANERTGRFFFFFKGIAYAKIDKNEKGILNNETSILTKVFNTQNGGVEHEIIMVGSLTFRTLCVKQKSLYFILPAVRIIRG